MIRLLTGVCLAMSLGLSGGCGSSPATVPLTPEVEQKLRQQQKEVEEAEKKHQRTQYLTPAQAAERESQEAERFLPRR